MTTRVTVAVSLIGLALTLASPAAAEWTIEASRTYVADQKKTAHPCCPEVAMAVLPGDTPAELCLFYSNNVKKKDRGLVSVFVGIIGLESAEIQAEMLFLGGVQDNHWQNCMDLALPEENCLVVAEFDLEGFAKLRKTARRTDTFTAGIVVIPADQGAQQGLSDPALTRTLRDRFGMGKGDGATTGLPPVR